MCRLDLKNVDKAKSLTETAGFDGINGVAESRRDGSRNSELGQFCS
jgi:hypothetical protein